MISYIKCRGSTFSSGWILSTGSARGFLLFLFSIAAWASAMAHFSMGWGKLFCTRSWQSQNHRVRCTEYRRTEKSQVWHMDDRIRDISTGELWWWWEHETGSDHDKPVKRFNMLLTSNQSTFSCQTSHLWARQTNKQTNRLKRVGHLHHSDWQNTDKITLSLLCVKDQILKWMKMWREIT